MKTLILLAALSGCYNARFPVTPDIATQGTYQVVSSQLSGTAWAVDEHNFITAGHVCEWGDQEVVLVSGARRIPVERVTWSFEMKTGGADICLLHSNYPLATGLVLATEMPAVGTDVCYVGFPREVFVQRCGHYIGNSETDISTDHGASGSPVFSKDGVFGVLVSLRPEPDMTPDDGFVLAGLSQIQGLIVDLPVSPDRAPNADEVYKEPRE